MQIKCIIQKEHSSKTNKDYWVLYVPDIEKKIFLSDLEFKMLSILYKLEK